MEMAAGGVNWHSLRSFSVEYLLGVVGAAGNESARRNPAAP